MGWADLQPTSQRTVQFEDPPSSMLVDKNDLGSGFSQPTRVNHRQQTHSPRQRSVPSPATSSPGSQAPVGARKPSWQLLPWQDVPTPARQSTADAGALPAPWEERVSRSTGEVYYFNAETGESTYNRPGAAPPDPHVLPAPWEERVSRSSGEIYYFNPQTNESTYIRPGEPVDPLAEGWEEKVSRVRSIVPPLA